MGITPTHLPTPSSGMHHSPHHIHPPTPTTLPHPTTLTHPPTLSTQHTTIINAPTHPPIHPPLFTSWPSIHLPPHGGSIGDKSPPLAYLAPQRALSSPKPFSPEREPALYLPTDLVPYLLPPTCCSPLTTLSLPHRTPHSNRYHEVYVWHVQFSSIICNSALALPTY